MSSKPAGGWPRLECSEHGFHIILLSLNSRRGQGEAFLYCTKGMRATLAKGPTPSMIVRTWNLGAYSTSCCLYVLKNSEKN